MPVAAPGWIGVRLESGQVGPVSKRPIPLSRNHGLVTQVSRPRKGYNCNPYHDPCMAKTGRGIRNRSSTRQDLRHMSRLLIKLRHAPDDEIQEMRSLLQEHRIDFYETQTGPWGISAPGIWLNDEHQYDRAKALIDDYQEHRFREQRAEYERLRRAGQHRTLLKNLLENPVRVVLYSLIAGLILYFSIRPFFPGD